MMDLAFGARTPTDDELPVLSSDWQDYGETLHGRIFLHESQHGQVRVIITVDDIKKKRHLHLSLSMPGQTPNPEVVHFVQQSFFKDAQEVLVTTVLSPGVIHILSCLDGTLEKEYILESYQSFHSMKQN